MTADTPRTDAIEFRHCPPQPKELLKKHQDAYALSRELERELNASKAEVERLRRVLQFIETDRATHDCTGFYRGIAFAALNPKSRKSVDSLPQ
jgi:hypothetical protein